MIKANELRVGNLLILDDDQKSTIKVESFFLNDGVWFIEWAKVEGGGSIEGCDTMNEFMTIPLTPEWLERCGFSKVANGLALMVLEGYVEISSLFTGFPLTFSIDGNRMPLHHVQYVHQLQNLFFSLTGEELQIKMQ